MAQLRLALDIYAPFHRRGSFDDETPMRAAG
jgi:hypothetical protein